MTEPVATTWWVFFPLVGLEITDGDSGLDSPMFGDATVLSKAHIRQIVSRLNLNERVSPGHDHDRDIVVCMENMTLRDNFHSFIAVKRQGSAKVRVPDDAPMRFRNEIIERAKPRASRIASLLAIALIAEDKKWRTCGLASQVGHQRESVAMLAFETKEWSMQGSGSGSCTRLGDPLRLLRSELSTRIEHGPANRIAAILGPQCSPVARSLTRAVGEAAIRLADALHASSEAAQLLGAVTAIEILITHQGDSYETTKKRIRQLVGESACEQFEAERVLEERHRYVHRGIEPSHVFLPRKATALALACLIQFAELTTHFDSKNAIVTYLDFLHTGSKMVSHSREADQADFNRLVKHGPFAATFPYFKRLQEPKCEEDAPTRESS